MDTNTSRYDGPPQEDDPNRRYWNITIDMGEIPKATYSMGGTEFSEEGVREQVVQWLRGIADKIERTGKP